MCRKQYGFSRLWASSWSWELTYEACMTGKGCLVARKMILNVCIGNGSKPVGSSELMRSTHEQTHHLHREFDYVDAITAQIYVYLNLRHQARLRRQIVVIDAKLRARIFFPPRIQPTTTRSTSPHYPKQPPHTRVTTLATIHDSNGNSERGVNSFRIVNFKSSQWSTAAR